MESINAVITGVGGYVPDYILTNDEISKMVDTTDEWIMGRIGIKERRILKEEGLGTSYIARKAAKQLIQRTKANPDDIDLVIAATTTPDYRFPSTASIVCERLGLKNAFAFDMQAVCSGFLYALETGANFIRSGNYKKVIVIGAEKMSSIIDYTDRATCPIFGDGGGAVMLEATTENVDRVRLLRAGGGHHLSRAQQRVFWRAGQFVRGARPRGKYFCRGLPRAAALRDEFLAAVFDRHPGGGRRVFQFQHPRKALILQTFYDL